MIILSYDGVLLLFNTQTYDNSSADPFISLLKALLSGGSTDDDEDKINLFKIDLNDVSVINKSDERHDANNTAEDGETINL